MLLQHREEIGLHITLLQALEDLLQLLLLLRSNECGRSSFYYLHLLHTLQLLCNRLSTEC